MWKKLWEKTKNFFKYIWSECKDWRTVALLVLVVIVIYSPVWVGYLLFFLFKWKWCLAASSAVAAFWAGPFTPFFPLCITITFALKKLFRVILKRRGKEGPVPAAQPEEQKETPVGVLPPAPGKTDPI